MEDAAQGIDTKSSDQARADETKFEWMVLGRSLQKADEQTRLRFCLCLQMLGLSLLGQYDSTAASELLARDEASLLAPFLQVDEDLDAGSFDYNAAHHTIALVRGLLEMLGGEEDRFQHRYDQQCSVSDNYMICGAIVDIEGTCSMEDVDPEQMHKAISRSKLMEGEELAFMEVVKLMALCRYVLEKDPKQDWVYV